MQATFFVICLFLIVKTNEGYLAKEIIIDRPSLQHVNSGLVDGIWLKAKSGGIPKSKGFACEDFNAELPGGISLSSRQQCECTREASTFSFFDGEWKCVDNEEFRESEGKFAKLIKMANFVFIAIIAIRNQ